MIKHVKKLNSESKRIWNANAEWWDDKIGDGNAFQNELIEPTTEKLLKIEKGQSILDIGCGAGRFARRMAELGANVVACDFSSKFISRAMKRTLSRQNRIEYHVIDATKKKQMLKLGKNRFDSVVSTMAIMDMPTISPMMEALSILLKNNAHFVFSISHPCFHSTEMTKFAEIGELTAGRSSARNGVKIYSYKTSSYRKTEGVVGQPKPSYIFHRPLEDIFSSAFRAGFVINDFKEPTFSMKDANGKGMRWREMPDIPPVLVVRMKLIKNHPIIV